MLSLLRSELYQLTKMLSIKLSILMILVVSIVFGFRMIDESNFETLNTLGERYVLYGGGSLCSMISDSAGVLLLASLFAGWVISRGFENRVVQESVSFGKQRGTVYLAKMLMYFLVTALCSMIYWLGTSIPAFIRNGLGTPEVCGSLCQPVYIAGMTLAAIMAYISLYSVCGVIAFWSRKVGITMGICFAAILFGGNLLAAILPEGIMKWIRYTPLGLYGLVTKLDVTGADIGLTIGISLLWTGLICGIGYLGFRRAELK